MPNVRPAVTQITTRAECRALLAQDFAVIFKHSRVCGTSRSVYQTVTAFSLGHPELRIYLISVLEFPTLSRFIAGQTGVRHESPQVLALRNGKVFAHACHWNITRRFLASLCDDQQTDKSGRDLRGRVD